MKALLLAPMASVHRRFNQANIQVLREMGYEVHLAANFSVGEGSEQLNATYKEQCIADGIKVHDFPFVRAASLGNLRIVSKLRTFLKQEQFSIVHAHTETGGLLLRLAMCGYHFNGRFFYTPHGMSFYKGSSLVSQCTYRPIEKWICAKMDANLAMNQEEYDVLKKWNSNSARYVHGVGLNTARFRDIGKPDVLRNELNVPKDNIILTAIGELNDNKNHRVVIEAMYKMDRDNIHFVVCGEGPLKEPLKELAKQYHLEQRVHFLGFRNDISDVLHDSDIFVFPSFHEGLPVSVMEAMAAGLPVVCSKIRGNVDLISDGKGGHLCDPNNADAFVNAIEHIIQNKELKNSMAKTNTENIKYFDFQNVKEELLKIYS